MHYFLGVDSGGTKADFLLGDETRELVRVPYENWNVIDRHGFLRWRPVEADTPLRNLEWFWHPGRQAKSSG